MAKPPAPFLVISNRGMKDTRGKAFSHEYAEYLARILAERDKTTIYVFKLISVVNAPLSENMKIEEDGGEVR